MRPASERELCCRFTLGELRQVRRAAGAWARRAGLGEQRAVDFVLALNEITTNAIRRGSPVAILRLHLDGQGGALAEVTDGGRWPAQPGLSGGAASMRGLPLARRLCDQVTIDPSPAGTTVTLRMSRQPAPRPGAGCGAGGQQPG